MMPFPKFLPVRTHPKSLPIPLERHQWNKEGLFIFCMAGCFAKSHSLLAACGSPEGGSRRVGPQEMAGGWV